MFSHRARITITALFLLPASALAMESMDDGQLSTVQAQDGLSVEWSGTMATADRLEWRTDTGTINESRFYLQDLELQGVDNVGNVGGDFTIGTSLDVGSVSPTGAPSTGVTLSLSNMRLSTEAFKVGLDNNETRSYGRFALDGNGQLSYVNLGGFLNSAGNGASMQAALSDSRFFYQQRQNDPFLLFNNLEARWNFVNGNLGIIAAADDPYGMGAGLIHKADRIDLRLEADWQYDRGANGFVVNNDELSLLRFGWSGGVSDVDLIWRGRGIWDGNDWGNPSDGLTMSARWNYINSDDTANGAEHFRWVLGEVGGGVQIELSDWSAFAGNPYGMDFPLVALDSLNGNQIPGGLCFGGSNAGPGSVGSACGLAGQQSLDLAPGHIQYFDPDANGTTAGSVTGADGLAVLVRNGNLLSNSNAVRLVENGTVTRDFNWGLIYSLANIDGNIYLYPGGNPADNNAGLIIDLLIMSQTFNAMDQQGMNWEQGSHFLIADTEFETDGVGIGFLSSNLLIGANDMRFWLKPIDDLAPEGLYSGGLDLLSHQARLNFRGTFGGSTLAATNESVEGLFFDTNLEGLINLRFSPSDPAVAVPAGDPKNFLGYSMAMRLGDLNDPGFQVAGVNTLASGSGSYIALAEPNRRDVEIRLADIRGDIAFTNGVVDLRGVGEISPGSRPALRIDNDILIGQTAAGRLNDAVSGSSLPGGAAGQPLVINDVSFSGENLGKIAIPSGHWGATLTLKPQLD